MGSKVNKRIEKIERLVLHAPMKERFKWTMWCYDRGWKIRTIGPKCTKCGKMDLSRVQIIAERKWGQQ